VVAVKIVPGAMRVVERDVAINQDLRGLLLKDDIDPYFLTYYFKTIQVIGNGTIVKGITNSALEGIRIPVPPLEVQREIVRILDQFTQLEAELEAELEARRRQYEHYRRLLLHRVKDAESVPLASLGKWQGGATPSKANLAYWTGGDIPWLASMDVSDESTDEIRGRVTSLALKESSLRVIPATSIAVVMRSNILRRTLPIGLINVDTTVNQDIRALVAREGVDVEYVYQALRADSEDIRGSCVRTDGSMAAVDSKAFFAWQILLPPLDEQRRVASELRAFDQLVNDLEIGLPAELTARRKQYEYYRDKLLTFEEAAA
jgi:type I restriction enzyme S subunit